MPTSKEPVNSVTEPYLMQDDELDPLSCEFYLSSPLNTILESLDDYNWDYVLCHDIIEAYNVLSTRIRTIAHALTHPEKPPPPLALLKEHNTLLARALKRDIRRAFIDPSHNLKKSISLYDSYASDISMPDEDVQHAVDISILCHYSLRVLSDIFAFPVLYTLFSDHDLNELLDELLKIALAPQLLTPNATKTISLVFWIMQSQQLPASILGPRKTDIVTVLRMALNDWKGLQVKCDSLKAIHSLLRSQRILFTTPFLGFLSSILSSLAANQPECRFQACNALSGLALTKMRSPEFPHKAISEELHTFLKPQIPPKGFETTSLQQFPLHRYLSVSLNSKTADVKEGIWAIITLISLLTLSDQWVYARSDLRFVVATLAPAMVSKRKVIGQLARTAWGVLAWAFTLLPRTHPAWRKPEDPSLPHTELEARGKAFRFLNNNSVVDLRVYLLRGLLFSPSEDDVDATVGEVSRALLVLRAMISGSQRAEYGTACRVLQRLVCDIGSAKQSAGMLDDMRPSSQIFEVTISEDAPKKFKDVAQRASELDLERIRVLSEAEIVYHYSDLVETWAEAVERTVKLSAELPTTLQDAWQSLLLMKADLTQENQHLASTGGFASQIVDILTRFLAASEETNVQASCLVVVKRLWSVMKNVFARSWLPAEKILAGVLKVNFTLEDERVRVAWSELCADLISVGIPTLLHIISTGCEGQKVTRQLWSVLSKAWQVPDDKAHWEELVSSLVVPFKSWTISASEIELWQGVVQSSMVMANAVSVKPLMVVERFISRLGDDGVDIFARSPRCLAILMAYIDLSESSVLSQPFMLAIDRTLVLNYPPRAESLSVSLEIIRLLGKMILSTPRGLLVQLLCAVEKGMCCWIADEKEALLAQEHAIVLEELYCSTLKLLREIPPSCETLVAITPFLCAGFGRLTASAIGPLNFSEFWRDTYHEIEEYRPSYPDSLKICLLGLNDAFGGSLADGLSMSQSSSIIPDSQPFYLDPDQGLSSGVQERQMESLVVDSDSAPELVTRRQSGSSQYNSPLPTPGQDPAIRSHDSFKDSGPNASQITPQQKQPEKSPSQKRPSDSSTESQHTKRRKTELESSPMSRHSNRRQSDLHQALNSPEIPLFYPSGIDYGVNVEPTSPFSVPPPANSFSQDTNTRKRKRIFEWVNSFKNPRLSAVRDGNSDLSSSGSSTPKALITRASTPTPEEYDTWETGAASKQDIIDLEKELVGSDNFVPETDIEEEENDDAETHASADVQDLVAESNHDKLLLENQQRPGPVGRTTSSLSDPGKLAALERAYSVLSTHGSQFQMEDLVHASGIVNRIQGALNAQLSKRLSKSEPPDAH